MLRRPGSLYPGPSEQEQEQVHDLNIEQMVQECNGSDTDTDATFDPKEELKSNELE